MKELTPAQRRFLEQPFAGVVTTLRRDGSAHNTVVWVDVDDRGPSFNTALGRVKPNNLERDPRVGLTVLDPNDIYRWIAIEGRVELTTDGADAQIDRLSEKYTGNPEYQNRKATETRVTVRIVPERISAHGLD